MNYQKLTGPTAYAGIDAVRIVEELAGRGVPVPDEVTAGHELAVALRARQKSLPDDRALRRRSLDALLADPAADIGAFVAAEHDAATTANVFVQAIDTAAHRLAGLITVYGDELTRSVAQVLAAPAIDLLTAAAATGAGATVTELVRAGDTDGANALVSAPLADAELTAAWALRARIYRRSKIDSLPCAYWRDPDVVANVVNIAASDRIGRRLTGLRRGGELWCGTFAEVEDASRQLTADRKTAELAERSAATERFKRKARRTPPPAA